MKSKEIWCVVKNSNNKYSISNYGRIRSENTTDSIGRIRKGKILATQIDKYGYVRIRVTVNNKKITWKLHRLVAIHFINNPCNLPQVNHIDGTKNNNYYENLEWSSNSSNQKHAVATGLKIIKYGKLATNFKSGINVYDLNMQYLYTVFGNKELLEKGFDFRLVSAVTLGKRKSHKGHVFKRVKI